MPSEPLVLIVEDDRGVAESLEDLLDSECLPCQTFTTAESFLQSAAIECGGCVLLDAQLPGLSGLELQMQLRSARQGLPVIIISGQVDVSDTIQAFENGAFAVLQKPVASDCLIQFVRAALEFSEKQRRLDRLRTKHFGNLTQREQSVLNLLVHDKSTKQIARELGISPSTVEKHRASIFAKAGVHSVVALARLHLVCGELAISSADFRPQLASSQRSASDAGSSGGVRDETPATPQRSVGLQGHADKAAG